MCYLIISHYRATHDRFEDYCLDRWALSLSRCNQLIHTVKVYDHLSNAFPQDAALLAGANEHTLRPLSRLEPELQTAVWELIRRIEERPAGTTIEALVGAIKNAITDGWEERAAAAAVTDTNNRAPDPVRRDGSTLLDETTRSRHFLQRQSNELGNFSRWANRVNTWDPKAIALADDELCLKRHLKTVRQLRIFCETLIQALETRLSARANL